MLDYRAKLFLNERKFTWCFERAEYTHCIVLSITKWNHNLFVYKKTPQGSFNQNDKWKESRAKLQFCLLISTHFRENLWAVKYYVLAAKVSILHFPSLSCQVSVIVYIQIKCNFGKRITTMQLWMRYSMWHAETQDCLYIVWGN